MTRQARLLKFQPSPVRKLKKASPRKTIDLLIEDLRLNPRPVRHPDSNSQILLELTDEAFQLSGQTYLTVEELHEAMKYALKKYRHHFRVDFWYYLNLLTHSPRHVVANGKVFKI